MRRVATLLASVLLVASCGTSRPELIDQGVARDVTPVTSGQPEGAAPSSGDGAPGRIRLAVDGWTGDPADAGPADLGRRVVADLLFEGLTRIDDAGAVRPGLADWTVSADRMTWTFTLAVDAVDSRGEPITARVVMDSLDRIAARGHDDLVASALMSVRGWADRMDARAGGVAGLSAPTTDQLLVELERPFEPLAEVLASPAFGIAVGVAAGLVSTGPYEVDERTGDLVPVDASSGLPVVELIEASASESVSLVESGTVDWAVVERSGAAASLSGDVVPIPLEVGLGLALRGLEPEAARSVLSALDTVRLADLVEASPVAPLVPEGGRAEVTTAVAVDVPEGSFEGLGETIVDQLAASGIEGELMVSSVDDFAKNVVSGRPALYPVVLAGGTWSGESRFAALVPGGVNDMVGGSSPERSSLGRSMQETRNREDRELFADLLVQSALDEGVFVMVGRFEAWVAVDSRLGLVHRPDGTLDLSALAGLSFGG